MKRFIIIMIWLGLGICLWGTEVSGTQSGIWQAANNPYQIVGDITVPLGQSLVIQPGVIVQAMGNFRINAEGTITAIGTPADSIYFQNAQNPPTNLWKGIRLENPDTESVFEYIVVEYADYGINAVDSPIELSNSRFSYNQRGLQLYGIGNTHPAAMNVHHNIIEHSVQNGILIPQNSNAWVHHNEVRYNGTATQYYGAIQLSNQSATGANSPIIEHNHIHHNFKQGITAWDIVSAHAINPTIRHNHIEANLTGIYLLNAGGVVHNNTIVNNFIAGDANSGAGIMISGATSLPFIAENIITGNFTGLYITNNAQPLLGSLSSDYPWAHGRNVIQNNIDESGILHSVYCDSYPQAGNTIIAENNDWGVYTADEIAIGINDHFDNPALPTVDFSPWYTPQEEGYNLTGSIGIVAQKRYIPADLRIIDSESGEVLAEYSVEEGGFSVHCMVERPFYAYVQTSPNYWGFAGYAHHPQLFTPDGEDINLGFIVVNDFDPFYTFERGQAQNIEGKEVFPVSKRYLLFEPESVDYFYDEGDYRYIYQHRYRVDDQWQELHFGIGQIYDKIYNQAHLESWVQNEVENGELIQRTITAFIDQEARLSFNIQNLDDSRHAQRWLGHSMSYDHTYLYNAEGFARRLLDTVNISEDIWRQYDCRIIISYLPEFRLMGFNTCGTNGFTFDFWWQPFGYSLANGSTYTIYRQDAGQAAQIIDTVLYPQSYYQSPCLQGSGDVLFWVEAQGTNGLSYSSEELVFTFPSANEDLVQTPQISVHPNPFVLAKDAQLNISAKGYKNPRVKLYNLRGQLVFSAEINGDSFSWNGKDNRQNTVGSGIYFMKIESDNAPVNYKKITLIR